MFKKLIHRPINELEFEVIGAGLVKARTRRILVVGDPTSALASASSAEVMCFLVGLRNAGYDFIPDCEAGIRPAVLAGGNEKAWNTLTVAAGRT